MNVGTLDFEIVANKEMLSKSLDEAKASLKNFTDAAKTGGADAQQAMVAASAQIEAAWDKLSGVGEENRQALKNLEKEYAELSQKAGAAFQKATEEGDKEYRALTERQAALSKEIQQRKSILREVESLTGELQQEEAAYNKLADKTAKNESRTASFRQQMRQLREEMALQEMQARETGGETAVMALRGTDAFKEMQNKVAMLTDAMGDAQQQARLLSHDNQGLQGVISAVSGVAGAMSVAQGAVGMFAGENENLQKIMTRVQSIMAITTGLQQVANTLNKDSAASLTVLNRARETFAIEMQKGNAALVTNTAATTASAAGANMLRRANLLLSASFKAVGAAIKSIPVIGWIIAGVTALVGAIRLLTKSSREAKEAQEEYQKAIADGAKEPVAQIENLAAKWNALGNDMAAKNKFVEDNASAFEELGAKVTNVSDAEALLVKNKDAFVNAQIAKAKALAATNKAAELQAERLELQLQKEDYETRGKNRKARRSQRDIDELDEQIKDLYNKAVEAERIGAEELNKTGVQAAKTYAQGTVGWYEKAIQDKQKLLKDLSDPKQYQQAQKEIAAMQKTLDGITGSNTKAGSGSKKDPYIASLENRKKAYSDYEKWANSTDEILQGAAKRQYENLLKDGKNYLEYLEKQRDELIGKMVGSGTIAQQKQLQTLNEQIAEETRTTILEEFDRQIERQLNGANSLIEKLAIIERERQRISTESGYVADEESKRLNEERQNIAMEMQREYENAQNEYYEYLESRLTAFENYQQKMQGLEERLANTTDSASIAAILKQMDTLRIQQQKNDEVVYDELLDQYGDFNTKKEALDRDFANKRRVAQLKNDKVLLSELEKEYKKKLSEIALAFLNSPLLEKFSSEADKMTLEEINTLIDQINNKQIELSENLTEEDINELVKSLKDLRKEVADKNPFTKLTNAVKEFAEESSDANLSKVLNAGNSLADNFQQITNSMRQIAELTGNESLAATADIVDDVVSNFQAAEQGAEAWGGWWGAIIGGVTDLIPKIIKWSNYNKELNEQIKESSDKVKELQQEYEKLEIILNRTYNSSQFELQRQLIANLRRQREELIKARDAMDDADEKEYDQDEYDAILSQIADIENKIEDAEASLVENLTQTTIPQIEEDIKTALLNAFANGASDAEIDKEIERIADKLMRDAAIHMLETTYLADAIKEWYEEFTSAIEDGTIDDAEQENLRERMNAATSEFRERLKAINEMFGEAETDANTLSGAIKGASQESIDLLAGYTNAVRINLIEVISQFSRQLSLMASVDGRMANAVEYLDMIYRRIGVTSLTNKTIEQQAIVQRPYGIIDE